jgi:tetratricopeptide (TPR) repeat protein
MGKVLVLVSLLGVVSSPALAQSDDVGKAKKLFFSGTKHFDLGEYDQALADFKEAYRLKDDPVLLYNIAQAHRMLKHYEEALRAYKTYLARSTDQSHRADVNQKIAALEEAIEKQNKASNLPPTGVITTHPDATEQSPPPSPTATTTTPPPATTTTQPEVVARPPERKPLYKKWWLWTAVGAVVVVAVGVGVGVGVAESNKPLPGTAFPGVTF